MGFLNHYKRHHKNLNLIRKKLGLKHSFASTALSVKARIPNVFWKLPWDFDVCNGLKVRPMVNSYNLQYVPRETFAYKDKPYFDIW